MEVAQRIEAARALGDLSENGDYHAAKDDQGKMEARIRHIEAMLKDAQIVETTEVASDVVAEGLRARMSYLEAAGWLNYTHFSIHPWDLALRDHGLTTSNGAADHADRLAAVLPSTTAQEGELQVAPSDLIVNGALSYARLWRRLAEFRTWRPLADVE